METAKTVEVTPAIALGEDGGDGDACSHDKADAAGATVGGIGEGAAGAAVKQMKTQSTGCRVGCFEGEGGKVGFLHGQNVDGNVAKKNFSSSRGPVGEVPCADANA